jgi:hypothetical protein
MGILMTNDNFPKKKRGIIFRLYCIFAYILIPFFLLITLLLFQLTSTEFYVHILKRSDLIGTYVTSVKWQFEEKIKTEIENKVHLEKFREINKTAKAEYDRKSGDYNKLNKSNEYDALQKEKDELTDLSFQRAPSKIRSPEEFKDFKESEYRRIDGKLSEIKEYRKINEDKLEKLEDEVDDLKDAYEDAEDNLKDKKEDAKEIIESHESSFKGSIMSDLKKISPALTEELNAKLVDKALRTEIEKIIVFFTGYFEQKTAGNVYTDNLDNYVTGRSGNLKVKLPEISISLWVEDEVNNVKQKRHLLSEIMVDRIKEIKDLKNREDLIKLFRFSESGLGEMIGRKYLNKPGLSINNGIIKLESKELTGTNAFVAQILMLVFTSGRYLKFILPVIALILFLAFFVDKERKYKRIKNTFVYPSVILVLILLAFIIFLNVIAYYPGMIKSPIAQIYLSSILNVAAIYFAAPGIALFLLFLIIGLFFKKKAKAEL